MLKSILITSVLKTCCPCANQTISDVVRNQGGRVANWIPNGRLVHLEQSDQYAIREIFVAGGTPEKVFRQRVSGDFFRLRSPEIGLIISNSPWTSTMSKKG